MRPYLEINHYKKRAGGVAQGEGPEFKPSTEKRKCTATQEAETGES
jgi:hypothetical protein